MKDYIAGKKIGFQPRMLSILIISTLALMLVLLSSNSVARSILAIPFVIVFPGYSMTLALWPENARLNSWERLLFGIGLSISIVILASIALNYLWEINAISVSISLFLVTVICLIAALSRARTDGQEPPCPIRSLSINLDKTTAMIIALSLVVSGSIISYYLLDPPEKEKITGLFITAADGSFNGLPQELTLGKTQTILINVHTDDCSEFNYTVRAEHVDENGTTISINDIYMLYSNSTYNEKLGSYEVKEPYRIDACNLGNNTITFELLDDLGKAIRTTEIWIAVKS